MAEPTTLAIGLKTSELDKQTRERLFYLSSNYECHFVDILDFTPGKYGDQRKDQKATSEYGKRISASDKYYGFAVAQTWNGGLPNFILYDGVIQINNKELFKKVTGKEGKILLIGKQV